MASKKAASFKITLAVSQGKNAGYPPLATSLRRGNPRQRAAPVEAKRCQFPSPSFLCTCVPLHAAYNCRRYRRYIPDSVRATVWQNTRSLRLKLRKNLTQEVKATDGAASGNAVAFRKRSFQYQETEPLSGRTQAHSHVFKFDAVTTSRY